MGNRPFDPEILQRIARDNFIHLLECDHRDKVLVIQSELMKPLDRVLGAKVLRQHGVVKIYRWEEFTAALIDDRLHHLFLVRPNLNLTHRVAQMFAPRLPTAKAPITVAAKCQLIYVPKKLAVCDIVLERYGAYGTVLTDEFNWSFLPLDSDLLSLELPDYFSSTFVDDTNLWFQTVAQALWRFQSLFGPFPDQLFCLGKSATVVANLTEAIGLRLGFSRLTDNCCTHVILFDRDVDPAAILLSCLTYDSLLDDKFGLNSGFLNVPKQLSSKGSPSGRLLLHSSDPVYASIRDQHFARVFGILKEQTEALQADFDKRHQFDVSQLKEFVKGSLKRLKQQQQSLNLHVGLSEAIVEEKNRYDFESLLEMEHRMLCKLDYHRSVEFIQDCMAQRLPVAVTFGLLCLLSVAQSGLPQKDYSILKREFLQAYGYDYLNAFYALNKMRLFFCKESASSVTSLLSSRFMRRPSVSSSFQSTCEKFNLIPLESVDVRNPECPSYVFNGAYIPLACQIVTQILQNVLPSEQALRTVSNFFHFKELNQARFVAQSNSEPKKVFLVVFLGGVTRAEIAGLRLIAQLKKCEIRIAATSVISKGSLLEAVSVSVELASQVPILYVGEGRFKSVLFDHCPILTSVYRPPKWCYHGTMQTLVGNFGSTPPLLAYERDMLLLEDGGQLALDWFPPLSSATSMSRIAIIVPGFTGSTFENYVLRAVHLLLPIGCAVVVFNNRGLANAPLLTPKAYCFSRTADLEAALQRIDDRTPNAKRLIVGYSSGGGLIVQYLARSKAESCHVHAALSISTPFNVLVTVHNLEKFWYRCIFNRYLTMRMRSYLKRHQDVFKSVVDVERIMNASSIREFDSLFTAPMNGYDCALEYYKDASIERKLDTITVPVLCLNAADDCFAPLHSVPTDVAKGLPNVAIALTKTGGHMGFLRNRYPKSQSFADELLRQFAIAMFENYL
ncbi:hydrolase, alpha/beta domain protein [Trichuris suis]|nr:hydrolase, alpha/beta domain protein [Trichuris suis]